MGKGDFEGNEARGGGLVLWVSPEEGMSWCLCREAVVQLGMAASTVSSWRSAVERVQAWRHGIVHR